MGVDSLSRREESPCDLLLHSWHEVVFDRVFSARVRDVDVLLELSLREDVAVFVLPEGERVLLNGVIGQVNEPVVWIVWIDCVPTRARPEVTPLAVVYIANRVHKNPYSDVEFPLLDQERPFDVFLYDEAVMFVFGLPFFGNGWGHRLLRWGFLAIRFVTHAFFSIFGEFEAMRACIFRIVRALFFVIANIILTL
jgi:hypothetical protein